VGRWISRKNTFVEDRPVEIDFSRVPSSWAKAKMVVMDQRIIVGLNDCMVLQRLIDLLMGSHHVSGEA
jgi:hypothetical protein